MRTFMPEYMFANFFDFASGSSWVFWVAIILGIVGLITILLPMLRGLWMRMRMSMQRRRSIRASRRDIFLRSRLADPDVVRESAAR